MNIDKKNNQEELSAYKSRGFNIHPSLRLNELYETKNYQGANPENAKIIFVGRDPNWHCDIDKMPVFNQVEEYLKDGIGFWRKYDIHHPFLSLNYKGDGKRYHKMFSKTNIDSSLADKISFVELIGFPTTGMSKKNDKEFKKKLISESNQKHLIQLDKILDAKDKFIFIAWGLLEDFLFINKELGLFENLSNIDKNQLDINDLNQIENIFIHKHFSDSISNNTIAKISNEVSNCLR
jgi:hypothetical protein